MLRPLFEENFDKVHWNTLSQNPNAMHLIEANPEKIDWNWLSANPNAIHLLEARGKAVAFPAPRPLRALPAGVEKMNRVGVL